MIRFLRYAAFFTGLAVLGWVGTGYIGSNALALAVTALIGACYLTGALDLRRFRAATATLAQAVVDLSDAPPDLRPWLAGVHPSLRNAVRRRIEGEPVGLPGPAMAPYLTGLLVLLGMLGTFLGMVLTLRGTGLALESATDLAAVRSSLIAPVQGLGLAFGTSVAGIATSAALGLLSALSRRERLQAAQALDACIATSLRVFSVAHQREESLKLLQRQSELMPVLVDGLRTMMETMERQSEASNARLLASQERFQGRAEAVYTGLASSVDRSLRESVTQSARIAGDTLRPVVEAALGGIARETASLQQSLGDTMHRQADQLSARFETISTRVAESWQTALGRHEQASHALVEQLNASFVRSAEHVEQRSLSLLQTIEQSHADLQSQAASRERQHAAALAQSLESMAASLQREWQQAGVQSLDSQQRLCDAMERTARTVTAEAATHAKSTIAEIAGLVRVATEAPRAAAEVIGELRQQLSDSMARDNTLLEERGRLLQALGTLLEGVNLAANEQRGAIEALVGSSASLLDRVGTRFSDQVDAEAGKLAAVAAQVSGSAVEVASLGEAFGFAVELFSQSNDKLVTQLQRIDSALGQSLSRSDEQLAYYVAQAREVVDLSLLSQQQIIEDLKRLSGKAAPMAVAAA
jgi:hypothetical protein